MDINEFREILKSVDRSYDDFVSSVISVVKTPGKHASMEMISSFIKNNPGVDSSDVLEYMLNEHCFDNALETNIQEAV